MSTEKNTETTPENENSQPERKTYEAFVQANQQYYDEEFEKAIEFFDKTLDIDDLDDETKARALYWKGESLAKLERTDDAIETFDNLAKKMPNHQLGGSASRRSTHLKELKAEMEE